MDKFLTKEALERVKQRATRFASVVSLAFIAEFGARFFKAGGLPSDWYIIILYLILSYPACFGVLCLWEIVKSKRAKVVLENKPWHIYTPSVQLALFFFIIIPIFLVFLMLWL